MSDKKKDQYEKNKKTRRVKLVLTGNKNKKVKELENVLGYKLVRKGKTSIIFIRMTGKPVELINVDDLTMLKDLATILGYEVTEE
jgi:hypothetical protein